MSTPGPLLTCYICFTGTLRPIISVDLSRRIQTRLSEFNGNFDRTVAETRMIVKEMQSEGLNERKYSVENLYAAQI